MVSRDPQTGKFVSSSSGRDWSKQTRISGQLHQTVPAADLAGGATEIDVTGDEVELVDFSDKLENDEVYRVHAMEVASVLALPTTATSEGNAFWNFTVSPESGAGVFDFSPSFYPGGPPTDEKDVVDIIAGSREVGGLLYNGVLYAENGHRDTVNGTAGGASPANEHETVHFGPNGPVYDRDDEIYAPNELNIDGVSDHAVISAVAVLLHGHVEELD